MEHGLIKLLHFPERHGAPIPLPAILFAAAVIEVAGGALLTLGLFTRAAAFVCAGEMMVAYFIFNAPQSPWPALNQGDVTVLFCWTFFYLVFAGGGAWSLDTVLKARRRQGLSA